MSPETASSSADRGDEVLAVAASHHLGLTRTDQWPNVAAHLVAAGIEGESTITLAGLSGTASGWEVDKLVPAMLSEAGAPALTDEQAADVVARLLAHVLPAGNYTLIRTLSALAPRLNYPGGPIGQAHCLAEWLDCEGQPELVEREQADRFEYELRQSPALRLPQELAEALAAGPGTLP
jgi:hypothetical protein